MKTLTSVRPSPPLHWVGDGFPVHSIFSYNGWGREMDPFLLLDYAAPTPFPPASKPPGVEAHPHRGFETVTIAYQGSLAHRDSSGGGGRIGPGDVQWMTAGSGIVHEEFHAPEFTRDGGTFQVVQLWVNLPAKDKPAPPGYQAILDRDIPVVEPSAGARIRVIAGNYDGVKGPAKTFTPINLWDARAPAGATLTLPLPAGATTALLVLNGQIDINGERVDPGDLAVFSREGEGVALKVTEAATILVMSGEPINEPVVGYGPFVMNTREEIEQAIDDYRSGKMGSL